MKTDDHICLVTDSLSCAGTSEKTACVGGTPCIIEDGVATHPDPSAFAGSIATSNRLVRVCVKEAGIPMYSAVKMITRNPVRIMGLSGKGEIKTGYDADVVIFDDEVNVIGVILQGEVVVSLLILYKEGNM
ncbi:MAG: amidohydrolase family protein [Clostridiaceae bacterium]|nr:amidohydrolase family protein [Clostridiaceae bacterium]